MTTAKVEFEETKITGLPWNVHFIDTFTSEPGKGNPTAVVVLEEELNRRPMQLLAAEFGLPVTAFLLRIAEGLYRIRYFTVSREIAACGHATLAASAVVHQTTRLSEIRFLTKGRIVIPTTVRNNSVSMQYPRYTVRKFCMNEQLLASLGIQSFLAATYCSELECAIFELEDATELRLLKPDFFRMVESCTCITEAVVTTRSDNAEYDYMLRSFCPWIGIDEDPVTGSIHSALAPYWSARLGKNELKAFQASKRSGEFELSITPTNVLIAGSFVDMPISNSQVGF
jgi:PhzF family phenazine biosynthesis protein